MVTTRFCVPHSLPKMLWGDSLGEVLPAGDD